MRRGHKRTQSANLATSSEFALEQTAQCPIRQFKMEIPSLLSQSSAKIVEKICQVETLNMPLMEYADPLFTFGRGFARRAVQQPKRAEMGEFLIAIPERVEEIDATNKALDRKIPNTQVKSKKNVEDNHPTHKATFLHQETRINKSIKENASIPIKKQQQKNKKPQAYLLQTLKSKPSTLCHKKQQSNLK